VGRWSRRELDDAFSHYRSVVCSCASTGDWNAFVDLFTDHATFVMSAGGRVGGREAIRRFLIAKHSGPPGKLMSHYPLEWYLIDEDRGWVSFQIWNRFADPGDGSIFEGPSFSLLKYDGNNLWNYEEDIYNPLEFADLLAAWEKHRSELQSTISESS
jgi:hypothetical protein